ncbi:MAG: EamA family transporter [Oscillospiraceae bacterium]|nr:EamA family transporter [Oscillospiraceae bacterium]
MWIALVSVYGILKGVRDVIKKKAMEKNTAMEVLFFYTLLSFLFVTPEAKGALSMDMHYIGYIMIKSVIIFIAWMCSFKAISKLPIGFFGIMDMSRVIFASVLGMAVLHETVTGVKLIGMALVLVGLMLVNLKKEGSSEKTKALYIILVLVSCLMNTISELLDKILMQHMESGQLQFWYMFFLLVLYFGYMLVTRTKINFKTLKTNYWILILSVLFVIGDKALFIACSLEDSTVIAMTLIKQCSVLITIIGGRLVFKEKHTLYRILCAAVIIAGIMVAVV